MQAADIAGIRAMLVHAISEDAKRFYERCGFQPSPVDPMTLMITMRDVQRMLIGENETRSRAGTLTHSSQAASAFYCFIDRSIFSISFCAF